MVVKYRLSPDEPFNLKVQALITMLLIICLLVAAGPLPTWLLSLLGGLLVLEVASWCIFRRWAMRSFWRSVEEYKAHNDLAGLRAEDIIYMWWKHRGIYIVREEVSDDDPR